MSESILNIENAIKNLDNLKFLAEKKPEGFYCSRFSQEGIIIVTNLRISFFFLEDDNEFKFDHMIYNMVNKVNFHITNDNGTMDLSYAYNKQIFNFLYKKDILHVKRLLELYIPDKVQVDFLEEGEKSSSQVPENEADNDKGTQIINLKETRPLLFLEKSSFRVNWKIYLQKSISLFILISILYFAYPYIYSQKDKAFGIFNYALNFIQYQRCDSEMLLIGQAVNDDYKVKKSLPEDLPKFIRSVFKARLDNDSAKDPWGSLYRLQEEKNTFKIISDGPDNKANTYDDFVKEFTKVDIPIE